MLKLTSSSNSSIFYYSDLFSIVSYSNLDELTVLKNRTIKYFNAKINGNFDENVLLYEVPSGCNTKIEIFDISGRSIGKIYDGKIDFGVHRFLLKNMLKNKGIYFIKIVSDKDGKVLYEKNIKLMNLK